VRVKADERRRKDERLYNGLDWLRIGPSPRPPSQIGMTPVMRSRAREHSTSCRRVLPPQPSQMFASRSVHMTIVLAQNGGPHTICARLPQPHRVYVLPADAGPWRPAARGLHLARLPSWAIVPQSSSSSPADPGPGLDLLRTFPFLLSDARLSIQPTYALPG